MKREILFRGKVAEGTGWASGDLLQKYVHHFGYRTIVYGGCVNTKVITDTVGQYTGFIDGDKDKIFEDDIIENDGVQYHVSFNEEDGCWIAQEIHGDRDVFDLSEFGNYKNTWIKGNIHDNPELLSH